MPFEKALGSIALAVNDVSCTRHNSPVAFNRPLATIDTEGMSQGTKDAVFMLASFCFDLSRKMEYIYKALHEYVLHADERLAREILDHNRMLHEAHNKDWESAARMGEEIIHQLWEQVHPHHELAFVHVLKHQQLMHNRESLYPEQAWEPTAPAPTETTHHGS